MKDYMELDPTIREKIMDFFKGAFGQQSEIAATLVVERDIDDEVERYRHGLEAEEKASTSSASDEQQGRLG